MSQISLYTLHGTYENQGSFTYLVEAGSMEGELEALTFINERYERVSEHLRNLQTTFNEAHPE